MKFSALIALFSVLTLILLVLGIVVGPASINISDAFSILFSNVNPSSSNSAIIHYHRLPETLTAITAGAVLSVCGLMLQTLFRNPLAGPSILGISSGASFGVVLILTGAAATGIFSSLSLEAIRTAIPVFALVGSFLVLAIMMFIYKISRNMFTVLLAGVMLSFLFSAMETVLLNSSSALTIKQFVSWSFGSFSSTGNDRMFYFLLIGFILILLSLFLSRKMDALQFGMEQSKLAGINPFKTQWLIIVVCAGMVGWITAFCGPIAFIGLCVPHIARPLVKSVSHFKLIILCALIGITVALFCLIITRLPIFQDTLPLNAITAFLGAPFVIFILLKYRNQTAF